MKTLLLILLSALSLLGAGRDYLPRIGFTNSLASGITMTNALTPTFSPDGGLTNDVTITSAGPTPVNIYYTTNGADPTTITNQGIGLVANVGGVWVSPAKITNMSGGGAVIKARAWTNNIYTTPSALATSAAYTNGIGGSTTFITSQTPGTLRNDLTSDTGMTLSPIGAADVVVTHLGRYMISGNSATHTISIKGSDCNVLASVSVNMSGGTPGTYVYTALGSSFTLTNGLDYYITSSETNGGDQWNDNDTVVTPTSVATVWGTVYGVGACSTGANANHSYGLVNFKYSSP